MPKAYAGDWPSWTWDAIPPVPEPAHLQMALEEVLLNAVIAGQRPPTLRFWEWAEPALVLGSHQSLRNEVDQRRARAHGFTITRRLSGGGTMLVEPRRSVTYSIYAPASLVADLTFVESFAFLDGWLVRALRGLGVDAGHRPINDIVSPDGKIGGAAQARRRGHVLHHTAMAFSMDPELLPELIRIGRRRVTRRGLRSAEKKVAPLEMYLKLSQAELVSALMASFAAEHECRAAQVSQAERDAAQELVGSKYSRSEWIRRLP